MNEQETINKFFHKLCQIKGAHIFSKVDFGDVVNVYEIMMREALEKKIENKPAFPELCKGCIHANPPPNMCPFIPLMSYASFGGNMPTKCPKKIENKETFCKRCPRLCRFTFDYIVHFVPADGTWGVFAEGPHLPSLPIAWFTTEELANQYCMLLGEKS